MDVVLENGLPPTANSIGLQSSQDRPEFTGVFFDDMLLATSFAPSLGNAQPWDIKWLGSALQLKMNRAATTAIDIKHRASLVAIGAASLNAEVVAAHHQQQYSVEHFPVKKNLDLVTKVSPNDASDIDAEQARFYPYLLQRKTNRLMGDQKPLPTKVVSQLREVTKHYPVKFHMLSEPEHLSSYAEIMTESDRLRHFNKQLHHEMTGELIWPSDEKIAEGIDVNTLGLEDNDLNSLSILHRLDVVEELAGWQGGEALGDYNRSRITSASAVVVLTVNSGSARDYVVGGKAMQYFWLAAEQLKLAVQPIIPISLYAKNDKDAEALVAEEYIDQVINLKHSFNSLFSLAEGEFPVIAFRVCFAPEPEIRSLRRS